MAIFAEHFKSKLSISRMKRRIFLNIGFEISLAQILFDTEIAALMYFIIATKITLDH